jgi:hypothetical protein
MKISDALFVEIWRSFSFIDLIWYLLPGALAGLIIGFVAAGALHARGLFKRGNRWHQLLLKLHFLMLPLCGAGLGLQLAAFYGAHQQTNARIEAYRPQVDAVATSLLNEFQTYLSTLDASSLPPHKQSVEGVLQAIVDQYLQTHLLYAPEQLNALSWPERQGVKMLERFQKELLTKKLIEVVSKKGSDYTGLDQEVVTLALQTPLRELISADAALGLAKKQVASMFKGLYIGVLIQLLALIALIWIEIALSRYLYRKHGAMSWAAASTQNLAPKPAE